MLNKGDEDYTRIALFLSQFSRTNRKSGGVEAAEDEDYAFDREDLRLALENLASLRKELIELKQQQQQQQQQQEQHQLSDQLPYTSPKVGFF